MSNGCLRSKNPKHKTTTFYPRFPSFPWVPLKTVINMILIYFIHRPLASVWSSPLSPGHRCTAVAVVYRCDYVWSLSENQNIKPINTNQHCSKIIFVSTILGGTQIILMNGNLFKCRYRIRFKLVSHFGINLLMFI